uniref:Uncharacterized protein n=1 Tax=Amphora coffeiformis TaxID=265554 RepID=A0A7S3L016_9STRA|mmetsp:Transcript_11348/g.21655  ORF Transcript_11348/g.21655 Transcript_11348/m.21655 type:complete len:107 (+) Transcript_11348:382-702(+)|eukprot:scaffold5169_cov172-Amphora_coffeaeformis.AAC.37
MPKRSSVAKTETPVGDTKKRRGSHKTEVEETEPKVPRSQALLAITEIDNTHVRIELAAGWGFALPQKGEDDPGCLIMWDDENIAATVAAMNTALAGGGAAVPAPPN